MTDCRGLATLVDPDIAGIADALNRCGVAWRVEATLTESYLNRCLPQITALLRAYGYVGAGNLIVTYHNPNLGPPDSAYGIVDVDRVATHDEALRWLEPLIDE